MNQIWNEEYLEKNKLVEPVFLEHWLKGLDHLLLAAKKAKLWTFLLLLLMGIHCFYSNNSEYSRSDRTCSLLLGLMGTFIAHPMILSYWSHLKKKNFVYEYSLGTVLQMMAVSSVYSFLAAILLFLLVAPGVWFMLTFCLTTIILAIERPGMLESFSLSANLVKGNYLTALKFFTLWPAVLLFVFLLTEYATMVAPAIIMSLSGIELPFSIFTFIDDFLTLFFQLSLIPPVVYLFAYLTDRRLHKGS